MPGVYNQLRDITTRLEKHYRDMQDFEFTIQEGKLYMLQTRNGKRTGLAAVRVAIQMVDEGLITKEEAIFRVEPNQLYDFLVPRLDEKSAKVEVLATGLPASPGAAVGQIVFTADDAVEKAGHGQEESGHPGARGNHAGRHPRNGSGGWHSDFARRHDQSTLRWSRAAWASAAWLARANCEVNEKSKEMRVKGIHYSRKATGFRSMARPDA